MIYGVLKFSELCDCVMDCWFFLMVGKFVFGFMMIGLFWLLKVVEKVLVGMSLNMIFFYVMVWFCWWIIVMVRCWKKVVIIFSLVGMNGLWMNIMVFLLVCCWLKLRFWLNVFDLCIYYGWVLRWWVSRNIVRLIWLRFMCRLDCCRLMVRVRVLDCLVGWCCVVW